MVYEEARSELLLKLGYSVQKLKEMNLNIYLTRVELQFKKAVELEDEITIITTIEEVNRLRSTWKQRIFNSRNEFCNQAVVEGVFVKDGKPHRIPKQILAEFTAFN